MKEARRAFVSGSGLALAGVAAGAITSLTSSSARASTQPKSRIASFGWEVTNLDNNGADIYSQVRGGMTLSSVNIDTAFMITSTPTSPGFAEVLCRAAVSHGVPKFVHGDTGAPFVSPESPNFGRVHVYNPNALAWLTTALSCRTFSTT